MLVTGIDIIGIGIVWYVVFIKASIITALVMIYQ